MNEPTLSLRGAHKLERPMRSPGRKRRQQLLDAAKDLLKKQKLENISFKDIYERADVPPGSAYHFFGNKEDLVEALVDEYYERHEADMRRAINPKHVRSWKDIVDIIVWRAANYHNIHTDEAQAQFSPHLRYYVVVGQNLRIAQVLRDAIAEFFELPVFTYDFDPFQIMVTIVSDIYGSAMNRDSTISDKVIYEAQMASHNLLLLYLGEQLPIRTDIEIVDRKPFTE